MPGHPAATERLLDPAADQDVREQREGRRHQCHADEEQHDGVISIAALWWAKE